MKHFSPAVAVCIAGLALMLYAGVGLATMPDARGGEARIVSETQKAPPPAMRERGDPRVGLVPQGHGGESVGV